MMAAEPVCEYEKYRGDCHRGEQEDGEAAGDISSYTPPLVTIQLQYHLPMGVDGLASLAQISPPRYSKEAPKRLSWKFPGNSTEYHWSQLSPVLWRPPSRGEGGRGGGQGGRGGLDRRQTQT